MVKRFGLVKTLNERLSRDSLAIENEEAEEPPGSGGGCSNNKYPSSLENERLSERVIYLTEQLVDCRSCLLKTQKELESLHYIKERQFKALVSQLLAFESGLRRKQRELSLAISQRDRLIREQGHIIRFLAGKSGLEGAGLGAGCIAEMRAEAIAKIPVFHEEDPILREEEGEEEEGEEHSGIQPHDKELLESQKKLSCIIETGSEHDSDSAIILDDNTSSGSPSSAKRISRSVSDVVTKDEEEEEEEEEGEEEGEECGEEEERIEEESHLLEGSLDSLLHTKQLLSSSNKKITKPRDLKNKSQHKKSSNSELSLQQTTTISRDNETGSVICSIFSHDTNENHHQVATTSSLA